MNRATMTGRVLMTMSVSLFALAAYSQQADEINAAVENKSFLFQAQLLTHQKGGTRTFSPGFELSVSGDSLGCNLPCFGRVYQPTIGNTDGGLNFTTADFDYQTRPRKKGGWTVTIKTRDAQMQLQLNLTVSERGATTVNVSSTDREESASTEFFHQRIIDRGNA